MNIPRIFANALARRVAFLLVAMLFAWIGIGTARAQDSFCGIPTINTAAVASGKNATYSTSAAALAACNSMPSEAIITSGGGGWYSIGAKQACVKVGTGPGSVSVTYSQTAGVNVSACGTRYPGPGPTGSAGGWAWTSDGNHCTSRSDYVGSPPGIAGVDGGAFGGTIPNGSVQCIEPSGSSGYCEVAWFDNGDGTWTGKASTLGKPCTTAKDTCDDPAFQAAGYTYNDVFKACQPPIVDCASNETRAPTGQCQETCAAGKHLDAQNACVPDENSCPAGNIRSPSGECLPGEGQCSAGEAKKPDGTCGKDTDGDGEAEDEENEDTTFSGGDSCDAPPSCSGDKIMCGQARIQWRIDCNTRKNRNISGGACSAMPICTGEKCDALEYSGLLMQWRTACALEKAANDSGSGEGGQPDWTKVTGDGTSGQGEEPEKPHRTIGLGLGLIDDGGLFGNGTCPQMGTLDFGQFGEYNLDEYSFTCTLFSAIFVINVLLGAFIAFQILAGRYL